MKTFVGWDQERQRRRPTDSNVVGKRWAGAAKRPLVPPYGGCRRGSAVMLVIVTLIVLTMLMGALVKTVGLQRDVVRSDAVRVQAEWLLESSANRAAARIKEKPDYSGETWSPSPEELGQKEGAVVEIKVAADLKEPQRRRVSIRVEYPATSEHEHKARLSREVLIDVPSS